MDDLNKMLLNLNSYVKRGIWRTRLDQLPRAKAAAIRLLRTAILTAQGFVTDNCLLRASSLTFYSLLSVVPVVAMAFGIAKGFGFEDRLQQQLLEQIPGQEEVLIQVVDAAHRFLENTKGGLIAGIGVVVLFWSVIKVLSHIENAFNHIWQIEKPRSFGRKFADYLSIMLLGPVLVIMSSSFTVFITTQIVAITQRVELLGMFSPVIFLMLKLVPYILIWLLFTVMYMLMPNTRVRILNGLLAGIIAGTAYQIAQWGYISFQIGVARYNAIYGSFAALPLFLIWLQLSWLIVLLGAEISYASQNCDQFEFKEETLGISPSFKQFLSLLVARLVIKIFYRGEAAPTITTVSRELSLPVRTSQMVMDELVESGVLSRTTLSGKHTPTYQPAVDTSILTVHYVIDALAKNGVQDFPLKRSPSIESVSDLLRDYNKSAQASPANRLLKDV